MKLVLFILLASLQLHAKEAQKIKVAGFDWCPAICPEKENPGYIVEIVEAAFKDSGYSIDIEYFPWLRAIHQTRTGMSNALIAPAKAEAPDLLYPKNEVGLQKTCFYVKKNDPWTYKGLSSFVDKKSKRKVAVVIGNSLEELNDYAKKNNKTFLFQQSEDFLLRAIKMFAIKRVNTFVYTESEADYYLNLHGHSDFKNAGCVSTVKLYIAFSRAHLQLSKNLIATFDKKMTELKKNNAIDKIMKKYGIKSW